MKDPELASSWREETHFANCPHYIVYMHDPEKVDMSCIRSRSLVFLPFPFSLLFEGWIWDFFINTQLMNHYLYILFNVHFIFGEWN